MHIAFGINILSVALASPRYSTIAFTLHNPPARNAAISRPLPIVSEAYAARRASIMEASTTQIDAPMIHRYTSPFFQIGENYDDQYASSNNALIILNTPIKSQSGGDASYENGTSSTLPGVLGALWDKSTYRVCADGGANRLHDATVRTGHEEGADDSTNNFLPDLITGDLDSMRSDVHAYYSSKGVMVVRVEDQDFHDLDVRTTKLCAISLFALVCMIMLLNLISYCLIKHTEIIDGN